MPPETERMLVEIFDQVNADHFAGSLPRPNKLIGNKLGGQFAFYMPSVHIIGLHPRTLQQDPKYIADSMLHELVHYALGLRTGDHDKDHGKAFVDLANEIGAALSLPAVRHGDQEEIKEWPQSVRPVGYAPWRKWGE